MKRAFFPFLLRDGQIVTLYVPFHRVANREKMMVGKSMFAANIVLL